MNAATSLPLFPEGAVGRQRYLDSRVVLSPCSTYRYQLHRRWASEGGAVLWLMLNPSTADAVRNDPTVERCERRARAWGFGGLWVGNVFAYRSTDPAALYCTPDPVGEDNDRHLVFMARQARMVVCAWGQHGKFRDRAATVVRLLRANGVPLHSLKLTGSGQPSHPLYLPYDLQPQPWDGASVLGVNGLLH